VLDESEQLPLLQSFEIEIHIWKYIDAPLIKKKNAEKILKLRENLRKLQQLINYLLTLLKYIKLHRMLTRNKII
jgi:hypothetical protein